MPGSRERFITEAELDRILQNYLKRIKAISVTSPGDMLKSIYDTDNDGKVNQAANADTVDGKHASDFLGGTYDTDFKCLLVVK